jgi:RNA polymerase sigma-70 factor (ECF subfamily)
MAATRLGTRAIGSRVLRFDRLYTEHGRALLAYAVRRAVDEHDAADVVGETFLVAWRRLEDVPAGDAARLWLYGVARRVLANQQRGERRRHRLAQRLGRELAAAPQAAAPIDTSAGRMRAALARLGPEDQEILRLAAWEELTPIEIARVLGVSPIAARSRLHRARKRLRASLGGDAEIDDLSSTSVQEAV